MEPFWPVTGADSVERQAALFGAHWFVYRRPTAGIFAGMTLGRDFFDSEGREVLQSMLAAGNPV
jgi:hypothetical protein